MKLRNFLVLLVLVSFLIAFGCTQRRGARKGGYGVPRKSNRDVEDFREYRIKSRTVQEEQELEEQQNMKNDPYGNGY